MKDNSTTIQWLKAIRSQFEKREHFFDVKKCDAIDDAISELERRVDPCEDKYVDGYIKGVENASKEYEAEIKKLIEEKDRLKRRLNDIYSTAGFKAAQVYDGRLNRLEESVNDLRSKVNTMSWDRCYICAGRKQDKQSLKDLINEYYGIKPLDIHCDSLTKYLNERPVTTDCFKTVEEYREDFLNEKIDSLEGDINRFKDFSIPKINGMIHLAGNDIIRLREKTNELEKRIDNTLWRDDIAAHQEINERIDKLEESIDLRFSNALEARCEIRDEIGDLRYYIKKLEKKDAK